MSRYAAPPEPAADSPFVVGNTAVEVGVVSGEFVAHCIIIIIWVLMNVSSSFRIAIIPLTISEVATTEFVGELFITEKDSHRIDCKLLHFN